MSDQFLRHFDPGEGELTSLVRYATAARYPVDLQFRRDSKTGREWATLYVGLTSVLDVRATRAGLLSLSVHQTHAATGRFDPAWRRAVPPHELFEHWAEVELYLDRIIPQATLTHASREGAVQAAVASSGSNERVIFDRETTPSFENRAEKAAFLKACAGPILDCLHDAELDFGGVPDSLGSECDALGVDRSGRLLAIEVKPHGAGSVAFVAAQALMYARVTAAWVSSVGEDRAAEVVDQMVAQRHRVGLCRSAFEVSRPLRVVPVVALQRGASPEMIRRMLAVRDVVADLDSSVEPIEIYEVSLLGDLVPLDESRLPDGRPRLQNFSADMNRRMVAWKHDPENDLPAEARAPGIVRNRRGEQVEVDYALPDEYAAHNLLPPVRQPVLDLFARHGISWHQGKNGPTPHLRSSQVQCLNALGAMISEPERIKRAFGQVVDIASVRDLGCIDPTESGHYLTFEFTGTKDYFGEGRGGRLTRGSHSTSVDAAFAYTTSTGRSGLALIEWKFTEVYPSADPAADRKLAERTKRYAEALRLPDGPVDMDDVSDLGALFHEPIYQLVRQQLLADQLRRDPQVDADEVLVVHVSSRENRAYQRSYLHPTLGGRGTTVSEVWRTLLRRPETFVGLDSELFLDPALTSEAYVRRYGDPASPHR